MSPLTHFLYFSLLLTLFSCNKQKIKVGASPVVSSAGIFLAKEKGYFKEQGLDIEVIYFKKSGAPMTVLLTNGSLDIGGGNLSTGLWKAIQSGKKIHLVADKGHLEKSASYINLIVRNDHLSSGRFKELKDLKGFKMGLTSLGGVSQQILIDRFLKKAGLSMDDVSFYKMSYGEMNIALKEKQIDATIQLEPYVAKAKIDSVATLFAKGTEVHPHQQSAAIFYSDSFVKNNPEKAKKFMIAYIKGLRDYHNAFIKNIKKEETIKLLQKHVKITDQRIWNAMIPIGLNRNGFINKESLNDDLKWYVNKGFLKELPNINEIVDDTFVEEALKKLGK
jgi:ABC-type nitrate/sulfonate/bicarbonate transport system substrate-binding protein